MNIYDVRKIVNDEKELYFSKNYKDMKRCRRERYYVWRSLSSFRYAKYYLEKVNENKDNIIKRKIYNKFFHYYYADYNKFGRISNVEIVFNSEIGPNCDIWHGGVVINGILGSNCLIHGNNIIGNKGKGLEAKIPTIGNNVDIGAGATIIGDVEIADNCIIGANSVVTKSFNKKGSVIIGVPGKIKE